MVDLISTEMTRVARKKDLKGFVTAYVQDSDPDLAPDGLGILSHTFILGKFV